MFERLPYYIVVHIYSFGQDHRQNMEESLKLINVEKYVYAYDGFVSFFTLPQFLDKRWLLFNWLYLHKEHITLPRDMYDYIKTGGMHA